MRSRLILRLRRAALAASAASLLTAPAYAQENQKDEQKAEEAQQEPPKADEKADEGAKAEEPAKADEAAKAEEPAKADEAPAAESKPQEGRIAAPTQGDEGPVETYTIQKGDTLWDLSNKFLKNPWYWPKIWSLNPGIENPHWIYPGNPLKIRSGEGGPKASVAQVEQDPGAAQSQADEQEKEAEPSIPSIDKKATPDVAVVERGAKPEFRNSGVSVAGRLSYKAPSAIKFRPNGIISTEELESAGSLSGSFEEKEMLGPHDTAYARFKDSSIPKVGAKYTLFRPGGTIRYPGSNRLAGARIKVLGTVKVLSVEEGVATVYVQNSSEEIERGDLVGAWATSDMKSITLKPNTKEAAAVILAAENNDLSALGEYHQVFIDKGTADGVEEGNTLLVHRRGDGLGGFGGPASYSLSSRGQGEQGVPEETVGMLVVVDAKEHVSTALVLKSVRELLPGEIAIMKPPTGSGGF